MHMNHGPWYASVRNNKTNRNSAAYSNATCAHLQYFNSTTNFYFLDQKYGYDIHLRTLYTRPMLYAYACKISLICLLCVCPCILDQNMFMIYIRWYYMQCTLLLFFIHTDKQTHCPLLIKTKMIEFSYGG
uniref:Uncharacterized protein n=1 Tax=Lepeophtheirus salmonis TaxID=72036 RepID=A0A0K2TJ90_LEPSM